MDLRAEQPLPNSRSIEPSGVIIFVDFDGTAAAEIASQKLLSRFADGNWLEIDEQLDRGEISFYECVKQQFGMIRGHSAELENFCKTELQLRSGFVEFVQYAESMGYEVHIVAETLDFMIRAILEREGLGHIDIICDLGIFENEHLVQIEFPNLRQDCQCGLGNCKGGHVRDHHESHGVRIFIGDGSNDLCGARHSDVIFARRRLAQLCDEQGLAYHRFEDFYDIKNKFTDLLL